MQIKREEAEEWCRRNGDLLYFETTAKAPFTLDEVFHGVAQELINKFLLAAQIIQDENPNSEDTVELRDGNENRSFFNRCWC